MRRYAQLTLLPLGAVTDRIVGPGKGSCTARSRDITTHYSAPELEELIKAANRVCGESPALVLLRQKVGSA